MCLSGGSGTWRFDGSHPESHGEVLPSCLVWEGRDERSPPSDQKVSFPLLNSSMSSQACLCMSFLPVFFSLWLLVLGEVGIFLAVKSSSISVSLTIQTRACFWKVATEQWLIQFGFQYLIISHLHPRRSRLQMFDVLSQMWKKNSSKVQYVDIYTARKWFPLPLCVASRLRDHVNDKTKLPILIFPEGKCDHVDR